MTQSVERQHMSYAAYLAAEQAAEHKHEYLRGEVWAMAGGSLKHSRLAALLGGLFQRAIGDRPCIVFNADARLRIEATDLATYPDVSIVCGEVERAQDDPHAMTNPSVIVEVLSGSTELYDRGDKWAHYQRIPALRAYLLVSQAQPRTEIYQRDTDGGSWRYEQGGAGASIEIAAIGATIHIDDVYRQALPS